MSSRRKFFRRALGLVGGAAISSEATFTFGTPAAPKVKPSLKASVLDFGAVGNGIVDDTAAIQAAIDTCETVFVPAGRYKCSAPLQIAKSGFKFYGDGELQFQRDFNGGGLTIAAHVSNIEVSGLTIRLLSNVDGSAFCGIYSIPNTASVVGSHFSNLKIIGAAFGINVDGGKQVEASLSDNSNQAFFTMASQSVPHMESPLDGRNSITGNNIKNSLFAKRIGTGGAHGIYVRGSGYNIISGNHIENMQGGILAASYGVISNNVILNCYEDNGIYCAGSKGLTIQGNYIENTRADGIAFNHAAYCMATGNQVSGAGNASFRLQTSHGIIISQNICRSKGISSSFVRSFIDADSPDAPYEIQISNNFFYGATKGNPFAFGTTPLKGAYRNWRINNNQLIGVNTSGLKHPIYGPYAIVIFGQHGDNKNLVVENNLFSEVVPCANDNAECKPVRNATRELDNVVEYVRD